MVWALLPLKDFVNAKKRLSGVLSAAERRRLFHVMVEDVLDVEISGSGKVSYHGDPLVTSNITGSGRVEQLAD